MGLTQVSLPDDRRGSREFVRQVIDTKFGKSIKPVAAFTPGRRLLGKQSGAARRVRHRLFLLRAYGD